MNVLLDDTIAALASTPGQGGRAVVRLSGDDALEIVRRVFDAEEPTESTNLTHPRRHRGSVRLNGVAVPFPVDAWIWPTPRSYTGQPSVELHCVSSPPLVEALLATLYEHGSRPARAGEFTLRAFLAGRIDLLQAEAVLGVIDAADDQQLSAALSQLASGISGQIASLHEELLIDLADLEAGLDFVDEDIEFVDRDQLRARLTSSAATLDSLLEQTDQRMHSTSQVVVVLAGLPNAGKSSLFNVLAGQDAAIVSSASGTTRDWLRIEASWDGCRFELRDTAGRDDMQDALSQFARAGAEARLKDADLIVWCTAADLSSQAVLHDAQQRQACAQTAQRMLLVRTKGDLLSGQPDDGGLVVSAHAGNGLERLQQAITQRLERRDQHVGELSGSTAARCRDSLRAARDAICRALELVDSDQGDELIAVELRAALDQTGQIAGHATTDDLLDRIFSRFCIGK